MVTTLGHYQIVSLLGAGGMGEVYLGTDTRLNRKVAIKLLPAGSNLDDDDAQRRMVHEARMVATIEHPNVCTIYEIGADGERPYIVMQYIDGETLLERARHRRLTLAETVDIGRQIALALSEAHRRGIVHRDIKPGNVMISSAGIVKVLDFGLARSFALQGSGAESTMATLGTIAGTTPYMSPEQLRAEPLDGRSDIFSLGVVLYEIASGARPFDRASVAATITAILTEDPAPIDSPLQPVIARALAKQPSRRFLSADALHDALVALADNARTGTRSRRAVQQHGRTLEKTAASKTGSGKRRSGTKDSAVDPAAEKLYLRGRLQWNKRHPEAMRQAIVCFQEAVERDPLYARAYAGLADGYLMLGFLQALSPRDVVPKVKAAAHRAIDLDATLAEPHASLGYVAGNFDWDWITAKRELFEAMRLNPNYPWAPHWYGLLASPRSFDEAMEHVTRARDLDPLSPITTLALGIPLHQHRRYQEAVKIYSNVLQTEPTFAPAYFYMGLSYEQLDDYEAAVAHLTRAVDIAGRSGLFVGALGHCLGVSGSHDRARQLLQELEECSRDRYVSPYNIMLIHLGLAEIDETLSWFERALEDRTAWLWMTPVEPRFDTLRGDPRFREMVGRHGLRSEP